MPHIMETLLPIVAEKRAQMIREHCKDDSDALALATAFALQAAVIWRELGGNENVAMQFYALADGAAVESE